MDKLTTLIQQARQRPDRISPELLKRLNGHLSATGQPLIFVPPAEPGPAAAAQLPSADLIALQQQYAELCKRHAADPDSFNNDEHHKLYRLSCLISHCRTAERMQAP